MKPRNIRALTLDDASQVADLHIQGIQTGFISSLGHDFVTALYQALAQSEHSFGLVAIQDHRVVGFVAFAMHIGRLYRSVLWKNSMRFGYLLAGQLFSWQRIKHIAETLCYPQRISLQDLPRPEVLAVAVDRRMRRQGMARELIQRGLDICRQRNLLCIKVCVGGDNTAAHTLYLSCGFTPHTCFKHHGIDSILYTVDLSHKTETNGL